LVQKPEEEGAHVARATEEYVRRVLRLAVWSDQRMKIEFVARRMPLDES
jgi:hypothetical protein